MKELKFNEAVTQFDATQVNEVTKSLLENTKFLKDFSEQHEQNMNNPHRITKEQLGLENVDNASPAEMIPEFIMAEYRENIKSGEKLSTLLGKTQKHFNDMKNVAFTGDYGDLNNSPILGDAASKESVNNCTTIEEGYVLDARQGQILQSGVNQVKDSIWNHKANKENPHVVTKEQIGLGNVENVLPGDLAPEFMEAQDRENIKSGEKLNIILGKNQKFFTDLKSVAFSGSYNHLSGTPELGNAASKSIANNCTTAEEGYVLDARQGRLLQLDSEQAKDSINEHKLNKNNPHGVTKEQLGLNFVENVTSSNLVPTFTEATTRTNIISGESISIIFGKVMKFFSDIKSVAFTGNYMDLINSPTLGSCSLKDTANNCTTTADGYVLDARQGQVLQTNINQVNSGLTVTNSNLSSGLNGCKITFEGNDFFATYGSVKKKLGNGVIKKVALSKDAVRTCTIKVSDYYTGSVNGLSVEDFLCDLQSISSNTSYTGSDSGPGSGNGKISKSFNAETGIFTASIGSIKTAANNVRNDCSCKFIPYLVFVE